MRNLAINADEVNHQNAEEDAPIHEPSEKQSAAIKLVTPESLLSVNDVKTELIPVLKSVSPDLVSETIFRYARFKNFTGFGYEEVKHKITEAVHKYASEFDEKIYLDSLRRVTGSRCTTNLGSPRTFTVPELMRMDLPPIQWVVEDLLPEGATILSGDPKDGKSIMALNIGLSVAAGTKVFGEYNTSEKCFGVLYLALEDNYARIKHRIETMRPDGFHGENLHLACNWSTGREAVTDIREFLYKHADTKLVIIDTLKKVRDSYQVGSNSYSYDYESVEPFHVIANDYSISVLIIHHNRKASADNAVHKVSGTQGLTGAVDQIMNLKINSKSREGLLEITGRDIPNTTVYLVSDVERLLWLATPETERISDERKQIIDALERSEVSLGPSEIADETNQTAANVRKLLASMVKAGQVVKHGRGKYGPPKT